MQAPDRLVALRRSRQLGAIGFAGLVIVAAIYQVSHEPAPTIRVLWRADVTVARRAELERTHLLANGRDPLPDQPRSVMYDLLDTSSRNIRALVQDSQIQDTHDIDREQYLIGSGARPSASITWLANRVPGVRESWAQWLLMLTFSALALVGSVPLLIESSRRMIRRAAVIPTNHAGDLFDSLPTRFAWFREARAPATGPAWRVLTRLVLIVLLVIVVGVPVIETWRVMALTAGVLAVLFGTPVARPFPLTLAIAAALVVVGAKAALPKANLAEGHNAFIVLQDGEVLERSLPSRVFQNWKARFEALYPPQEPPYQDFSWRAHGAVPATEFARSSDAIWRTARYTRQVDAIRFRSLEEFRGGFVNDMRYNFWAGDLSRMTLPFFVMYELPPSSVGSRLWWRGQVFWEDVPGEFEEILHQTSMSRFIRPADIGKRVYAVFFPAAEREFEFWLELSARLRMASWANVLLSVVGGLSVLIAANRPRWSAYLRALLVLAVVYALVVLVLADRGTLGGRYAPFGGGDDGMLHDNAGRSMAMLAGRGEFIEALRGSEDVYWFTPGMRYFRMVEKLIFGDTNHLYALVVACLPLVVFYLCRHLLGPTWAWIVTALYCIIPVGNLSLAHHAWIARVGDGETAAIGSFLLGLVLLLRATPEWGGRHGSLAITWTAGVALAVSMFIRPNHTIAVLWVTGAYAWIALRRRNWRSLAVLASGLGLALWMPFHNWFYGHGLYLFTGAVQDSIPLGAGDYAAAVRDLLTGRTGTVPVTVVAAQLRAWLFGPE